MRVLFDTSVLVAAIVEAHPAHTRALPWLQRVKAGIDTGVVAAHSVAEMYAVLTTLPIRPRISPSTARHVIGQNVLDTCEIVSMSDTDYAQIVAHLATAGILGGATYDALILHAAVKVEIDQVLTLNPKDFRRIYPALATIIVEP